MWEIWSNLTDYKGDKGICIWIYSDNSSSLGEGVDRGEQSGGGCDEGVEVVEELEQVYGGLREDKRVGRMEGEGWVGHIFEQGLRPSAGAKMIKIK